MKPKPLTPKERNKQLAKEIRKLARMAEKGELSECWVERTGFFSSDSDQVTVTIKYFEKESKHHE